MTHFPPHAMIAAEGAAAHLERDMNRGERQVIAEKISSTVRILELLGLEYEVRSPKNQRAKGNQSPRVVYVDVGDGHLRVYNDASGRTWANESDGTPTGVKSVEELYNYLVKNKQNTG